MFLPKNPRRYPQLETCYTFIIYHYSYCIWIVCCFHFIVCIIMLQLFSYVCPGLYHMKYLQSSWNLQSSQHASAEYMEEVVTISDPVSVVSFLVSDSHIEKLQ